MNFNSTSMQSTYDFASMSALKKGSTGSSAERAQAGEKVAAEFEAEFLRLVTSSMQKASEPFKSDLFSSNSSDFYQDMFYSELGHFLAQRKSIGVADFVVNSLSEQGQKGSGEV
jgi:flagellar protein FlgJ